MCIIEAFKCGLVDTHPAYSNQKRYKNTNAPPYSFLSLSTSFPQHRGKSKKKHFSWNPVLQCKLSLKKSGKFKKKHPSKRFKAPTGVHMMFIECQRVSIMCHWVSMRCHWVSISSTIWLWVFLKCHWVSIRCHWGVLMCHWVFFPCFWVSIWYQWVSIKCHCMFACMTMSVCIYVTECLYEALRWLEYSSGSIKNSVKFKFELLMRYLFWLKQKS